MTSDTLDTGIIGRIHAAFNRRDLDGIAAELTEDVVFHRIPGVEGAPPTLQGRDAVVEQFRSMMQLGEQTVEHHNAEALAGFVVGVGTATLQLPGGGRSVRIIDVCRLRDGKLAERWAMFDRPDELERIVNELGAQAVNT